MVKNEFLTLLSPKLESQINFLCQKLAKTASKIEILAKIKTFFNRNPLKKYMLTALDSLISIVIAKYVCFKHMFAILRCDSVLYSQNRQNSEVWY